MSGENSLQNSSVNNRQEKVTFKFYLYKAPIVHFTIWVISEYIRIVTSKYIYKHNISDNNWFIIEMLHGQSIIILLLTQSTCQFTL